MHIVSQLLLVIFLESKGSRPFPKTSSANIQAVLANNTASFLANAATALE
jgi:hypothetical protein